MYLIYKRTKRLNIELFNSYDELKKSLEKNIYTVVLFNSLNEIKEALEKDIYGEYKYCKKTKKELKNNYEDFEIISNSIFPYELCNNYSHIKNIILNISEKPICNYYLLNEHHYTQGVNDYQSNDGKKLIFDNLIDMKKYCESKINELPYIKFYFNDGSDLNCKEEDYKKIDVKFNMLKDYQDLNLDFKITNLELKNKINNYSDSNFDNDEKIKFTIGNDFYVEFTIKKIKFYNNLN